jgi:NAD(P)H dehydrogenase (quinone)
MKHAVILAHPNPASFNAAVARTYVAALLGLGHQAELRDLYAMDFDPRLKASEIPWAEGFAPATDVVAERAVIAQADAIAFVYPFWFNFPPAMIKGYVERVFGMGFGYEASDVGTRPLMTGKLVVSITTSGAPNAWIDQTGALQRLRAGFDDHLASVCGFAVLEHLHLGAITPGMRPDAGEAILSDVTAMAERLYRRVGS